MNNMNPIIEETLEKGITSLLIKRFKYEKTTPERETRFHPQLVTISMF